MTATSNALRQPFLGDMPVVAASRGSGENLPRILDRFVAPTASQAKPVGNVFFAEFAPAGWRMAIRKQFSVLRVLEPGWDGANSVAIADHTLAIAAHALEQALFGIREISQPAIVPCADGGLQIEWCVPEGRFEMYFYTDGEISAWMMDQTGVEHEATGLEARDLLKVWTARLGRPEVGIIHY